MKVSIETVPLVETALCVCVAQLSALSALVPLSLCDCVCVWGGGALCSVATLPLPLRTRLAASVLSLSEPLSSLCVGGDTYICHTNTCIFLAY